jgi:hypothetical protein
MTLSGSSGLFSFAGVSGVLANGREGLILLLDASVDRADKIPEKMAFPIDKREAFF